MAEIDPVILELRAELGKYRADLKSTTSQVERLLGNQERSAQRLEKQMLKSSTAIGGALRGLATTLGTYFTGRELTGMIDSFTRLQNSLRVAGLEGQNLERVQSSLLDLSTRYGVGIEGLANLYGKATDAGRSFGASEGQILQLTEATSQALLITGTSAAQAQGAILGLSQALASGTVRAEEYNQINEGGLRPLLQAAAASERFGGDINKLRAAMLDGKVSSQEFFNSILAGSQQLEGQASKATLTLSGAFEGLTSRLTVYIGEAAKSSGVTEALALAMQKLAENLDTIIPALAIIGTALTARLVVGAVAGSAAMKTLAAYASIATTSLAGTALAAQSAGAAMLRAFGGPVGLAVTGLTVAIGALAYATRDTAASLEELQAGADSAQRRLEDAQNQAKKAGVNVDALKRSADGAQSSFLGLATALRLSANAMAEVSKNAKLAAIATIQLENAKARSAITEITPRVSGIDSAAARNRRLNAALGQSVSGYQDLTQADRDRLDIDRARLAVAKQTLATNKESEAIIRAIPEGKYVDPNGGTSNLPTSTDTDKKKKGRKGASGPSTAEIEDRFNSELFSIAQQTISARQSLATSAEERAELELRAVELARTAALESLNADKDYSAAQKARVRDALENLAEFERERVARDLRIQQFEEANDLADAEFRAQSDALRQQYDLAESQAARRKLAFEIIDLEYRERDAALERIKNNEDLADAVRQRAAIEQAALRESQGRTMEQARRDTAGPLENYFDRAKMDAEELNEAYQQIAVDGLGSVTDGLAETATGFLKLGGTAGKVIDGIISDLIRLFIQQQIVGLFGSIFGGGTKAAGSSGGMGLPTFGRASGGYVAPGQTVRVNEHLGGAEYLRMGSQGGTVIPLGQVNQAAAQPVTAHQGPIELRVYADRGAFISDVQAISQGEAVKVTLEAAPAIIDRAANETIRRSNRPRMPGAGR